MAEKSEMQTKEIINKVLCGKKHPEIPYTLSYSSLRQSINYKRRKIVKDEDIIEPTLGSNVKFYQYSPNRSCGLEERTDIAIFFNNERMTDLKAAEIWSIDGTFSVCPKGWKQFYTVSIIMGHHAVPIVYALLPSKAEIVYNSFLSILNSLIPNLAPKIIISDFEKAALNSFIKSFPHFEITGFIHYNSFKSYITGSNYPNLKFKLMMVVF